MLSSETSGHGSGPTKSKTERFTQKQLPRFMPDQKRVGNSWNFAFKGRVVSILVDVVRRRFVGRSTTPAVLIFGRAGQSSTVANALTSFFSVLLTSPCGQHSSTVCSKVSLSTIEHDPDQQESTMWARGDRTSAAAFETLRSETLPPIYLLVKFVFGWWPGIARLAGRKPRRDVQGLHRVREPRQRGRRSVRRACSTGHWLCFSSFGQRRWKQSPGIVLQLRLWKRIRFELVSVESVRSSSSGLRWKCLLSPSRWRRWCFVGETPAQRQPHFGGSQPTERTNKNSQTHRQTEVSSDHLIFCSFILPCFSPFSKKAFFVHHANHKTEKFHSNLIFQLCCQSMLFRISFSFSLSSFFLRSCDVFKECSPEKRQLFFLNSGCLSLQTSRAMISTSTSPIDGFIFFFGVRSLKAQHTRNVVDNVYLYFVWQGYGVDFRTIFFVCEQIFERSVLRNFSSKEGNVWRKKKPNNLYKRSLQRGIFDKKGKKGRKPI